MKYRFPYLVSGRRKNQNTCFKKSYRWDYPLRLCRFLAEDSARRIQASREEFQFKFFRGDCHSHTNHSDGCGTVAETAEMAKSAGLDFQYVTDHWGITQAPECKKHGLWVGQEPPTQYHHLGILDLDHAFEPKNDFLEDYAELVHRGATVFIPHPAGWWPTRVYTSEQKKVLEKLNSPFLMEICNGANNIVSPFDFTDDSAVELWDHLLTSGKVVHAMGNTDAHTPHSIGMVWNGVFASRCDEKKILQHLRRGHHFVSNGPLIHLQMGRNEMGMNARLQCREKLQITVVDSRGIARVEVILDGKKWNLWHLDSTTKFIKSILIPKSTQKYVRVEVRSLDGARAYSNPIYFGKT